MTWLSLAIISYLLLAFVNLGDKFIVDKMLRSGQAYAFVVGFLGAVVFLLAPWFLEWPGLYLFLINIIVGALFIFALWTMFEALKAGEASRIVIVIGSIIPVFTIIFSILIFKESFSNLQWLGILFLLAGMLVMSFLLSRRKNIPVFLKRISKVFLGAYNKRWIFLAIVSALLYACFFIGTKYAYQKQEFLSSFIWIRAGGFLVALLFLLDKKGRKAILKSFKDKPKIKIKLGKGVVVLNQILGSVAFLIQNYAIYLGPVAIINALQGVQYAFLLILGIFFSIFYPQILKEDISKKILFKKALAIFLVAIGLYFISL